MAAPLINQGTLNRALSSVEVISNASLTVTSGYFGLKVARLSFEGDASDYIGTLTGAVPSGRLYQFVSVTFYLVRAQGLAQQWEQQRLTNTNIGDVNIVTDSSAQSNYYLYNCTLMNISDFGLDGTDVDFPVVVRGTYPVNSSLFG